MRLSVFLPQSNVRYISANESWMFLILWIKTSMNPWLENISANRWEQRKKEA
jgi:hypothetical protein